LKNLTTAGRGSAAGGYPAELGGAGGFGGDLRDDQVSLSGVAGGAGAAMLLPPPGSGYEQQLNAIKGLLAEDTGRVAQVVKEWINADE
jgi:flagellar M-ring protein FliF